jgi:heme/copper-type cytochrome/quinol oxidase subunit 2
MTIHVHENGNFRRERLMKMGFLGTVFFIIVVLIVGFMLFSYVVFKRYKNKTKEALLLLF